MSTIITPERKVTLPPPDNPWYYGYRDVNRRLPDGTFKHERIPLTLEDTLHPQEGDCIVESDIHGISLTYLATVFRWRTVNDPEALILSDTGVYWDNPNLPYTHHSPDISVIFGIKSRKPIYRSFHVGEEGVRPSLIIEVVSPNNRKNDVESKMHEYHENEVPMYVIADRRGFDDPWILIGYRWRPDDYVLIPPNVQGRIWLDALDLWLGADGMRLVCYEQDGTDIGDYTLVAKQREAEKQRAAVEKQIADAAVQRADAAERRADAAERIANSAEQIAAIEKQTAEAAARRADAEKLRAEAAEAKARELEAELARLRGQ